MHRRAHATRAEFQWHHQWRVGDILIRDNRCVMHYQEPFDGGARRVMHHAQCAGERPFYDEHAAAHGPHPRGVSM